jgi:hypothetical protein
MTDIIKPIYTPPMHKIITQQEYDELMRVKREYEYIIGRINNKLHELKSADYLNDYKEIQDKITLLNEILNYV